MDTSQRVADLIADHHMMQSTVADHIGISKQALSNKLHGLRTFTKRDILQLADFFNVSTDYLLCRIDTPWPETGKKKK